MKGLYKKAKQGIVKEFTGISSPYEVPEASEISLDTTQELSTCVKQIVDYLNQRNII